MVERIRTHQREHVQAGLIDSKIANKIGLNGNVEKVTDLLFGMSDARVIKVETTDKGTFVIKLNPKYPEKVKKEIDGYELFKHTPLEEHIPVPLTFSAEESFMVLPFIEGMQLREGIKHGQVPEDVARKTLAELLSTKKEWWSEQPKMHPNGDLMSMQRKEWADTGQRVHDSLVLLSQRFNIPLRDLWLSRVVHQGYTYPSLRDVAALTAVQLQESPPYAKNAHGDASGANIIVDPEKKKWKLIDAEWAGPTDPAEALVRMTKYVSTTTVQEVERIDANHTNGKIHLDMQVKYPQTADALQSYGTAMSDVFGYALGDPDFTHRFNNYMAGSYLRELALCSKRGNPDLAFFAIVKAGEQFRQKT